jgi:hypothetical protein
MIQAVYAWILSLLPPSYIFGDLPKTFGEKQKPRLRFLVMNWPKAEKFHFVGAPTVVMVLGDRLAKKWGKCNCSPYVNL